VSKYNITSKASLLAKILVVMVFIITALLLILLWGIAWFSTLFLIIYSLCFILFFSSLRCKLFECLLSDNGFVEVEQPVSFAGQISARSFYNAWVIFLCIEEHDPLLIQNEFTHKRSKKWFLIFNDSVDEQSYRLIARLIVSARWA